MRIIMLAVLAAGGVLGLRFHTSTTGGTAASYGGKPPLMVSIFQIRCTA